MNYQLFLPFPPTVNNYYVKTGRGIYISQKGKKFREAATAEVIKQLPEVSIPAQDRLLVEIILYPPDKRRRDVDNYNKSLLDALTHTGIWDDDSQIDQLFIYRGKVTKPGLCMIKIGLAGPIMPLDAHTAELLD